MIKALLHDTDGTAIVIIGVDEVNVSRLKAGVPLSARLDSLDLPIQIQFILYYGKDEASLIAQIGHKIGPGTVIHDYTGEPDELS